MKRSTLIECIDSLEKGLPVSLAPEDFPCFAPEALVGNEHVAPSFLERFSSTLTAADIPTLARAVRALDEGDLAWLGFKVVYDSSVAVRNVDNEVTKRYGDTGSADGESMLFFCNDAKEIVSSREPSPRDVFQMKDVTRGPSMHNDQFPGLTWLSVPLFDPVRVWLLGASDVASELAGLAAHVGFDVVVADYDPAYLNEARFPRAERILLPGGNFDALVEHRAAPEDYVCVLTRGHMHDPEGCLWGVAQGARYVGMMGCAGKNGRVHDLVAAKGMTDAEWESVKRPIGLSFGAKTPAELAIAIVAELIDVRYRDRYSEEARARHESSLGR